MIHCISRRFPMARRRARVGRCGIRRRRVVAVASPRHGVDASRRRFRRPASVMRAFAGALGRRAVIRARGVDAFDVIQVRRESFMNLS